jgi:hypothetical protein
MLPPALASGSANAVRIERAEAACELQRGGRMCSGVETGRVIDTDRFLASKSRAAIDNERKMSVTIVSLVDAALGDNDG